MLSGKRKANHMRYYGAVHIIFSTSQLCHLIVLFLFWVSDAGGVTDPNPSCVTFEVN